MHPQQTTKPDPMTGYRPPVDGYTPPVAGCAPQEATKPTPEAGYRPPVADPLPIRRHFETMQTAAEGRQNGQPADNAESGAMARTGLPPYTPWGTLNGNPRPQAFREKLPNSFEKVET